MCSWQFCFRPLDIPLSFLFHHPISSTSSSPPRANANLALQCQTHLCMLFWCTVVRHMQYSVWAGWCCCFTQMRCPLSCTAMSLYFNGCNAAGTSHFIQPNCGMTVTSLVVLNRYGPLYMIGGGHVVTCVVLCDLELGLRYLACEGQFSVQRPTCIVI
jgi:hypothetical protein